MNQLSSKTVMKKQHLPVLDGIRGLAIFLVLMHHGFSAFTVQTRLDKIFKLAFATYGWIGVDLFFVLSGFLITGILLETKNREAYFKNFYMRRVLRIFPLYYLGLIFFFFLLPHFSLWAKESFVNGFHEFPWFLTYLMNYRSEITVPLGHFWSLCIEEQFYFFWPLMVWLLRRRHLMVLCIAAVVLIPILRFLLWNAGFGIEAISRYSITRIDSLLMGAFLALSARGKFGLNSHRHIAFVVFVLIGTILMMMYIVTKGLKHGSFVNTIGLTVIDLFFCCAFSYSCEFKKRHLDKLFFW